MNAVTARANPGTLIQLDQCKQCGGIWCDKWELFPVDPEEAGRLEAIDVKLLTTPLGPVRTALYCPRCTGKLVVFNDPLLPKEIELQRCTRCEGIWLNRGQLGRYKRYQKKTRTEKMGATAVARKLPEVYQDPKSWVVTGTQGMFAYPRATADDKGSIKDTFGDAFKLVLQTLLRMALGI